MSATLGLAGVFSRGGALEGAAFATVPRLTRDLIGLNADDIRDLLGTPARMRREPPAEVWQYHTDSCVLDLYLYGSSPPGRVEHAEVRPFRPDTDGSGDFAANCLRDLRMAPVNRSSP